MKQCSYCDLVKKLTKEHIWPKCIINRMPELEAKYLDSKKIFISAELIIADVCAECNNIKLSPLDTYLCQLYDKYFNLYIEKKTDFIFEYDYELLLRTLLKITYNSSRTVNKEENDFFKYRKFILEGGVNYESIVVKLDVVKPSIINGVKVYPKSARCGKIDVGYKSDKFILRAISINSYYFYIIISKDEYIHGNSLNDFHEIYRRVPGTIIHPYQNNTLINKFSNDDSKSIHIDFILKSEKDFNKYMNNKNNS